MNIVNLKDGEEIVHMEQGSVWPYVPGLVFGIFMLIVPFFFFFPLVAFGVVGFVLLVMIAGIGIVFLIRGFLRYSGTVCIFTNQRIMYVRQFGIFEKSVASAELGKITDISYRKPGFLGVLFRIGAVRVGFSGVVPSMLFVSMRRPRDLVVGLRGLLDEYL